MVLYRSPGIQFPTVQLMYQEEQGITLASGTFSLLYLHVVPTFIGPVVSS